MKRKIIPMLIIIMMFVGSLKLNAFSIYVTDWAALAERAVVWIAEKAEWIDAYNQFKDYKEKFDDLKESFSNAYAGFKNLISMKDLFVSVDELIRLIDLLYNDPQNMDSWFKIFKGKETILDKYPNIENYDFVRGTPIYKRSPVVQKQLEEVIQSNKEEIDNMQNIANILQQYRVTEKEMLSEIKKEQDEIKKYGLVKKSGNAYTLGELFKVAVANASIRLQGLISEVNTVAMIRMMLENEIKDRINEINDNLKRAREDAAAAEANKMK